MTSDDLLELVKEALLGADDTGFPTDAGDRVRGPGDLPTQSDDYPLLKVRLVSENRQSLGRDTVIFQTMATVRVIGEVSAPATLGDVSTSSAEPQLWRLKRQVEIAVINSYPLFRQIQQLASIASQLAFSGDQGQHLAGMQSDFAFEFIEGGDDFAPIAADDLEEAHAEIENYPETPGFTTPLPQ